MRELPWILRMLGTIQRRRSRSRSGCSQERVQSLLERLIDNLIKQEQYTGGSGFPGPQLNKFMMHAGLRPLMPMIRWHIDQKTQTYTTTRRIANTVSRVVVLSKPTLGTAQMLQVTVQEYERGNAGQDLLEVGVLKLIKSRSLNLRLATTQLTFWFPADDFLENATMINHGSIRYKDSSYVVDHSDYRVGPANDDVYVFQSSHYASTVDPYTYDNALPAFELKSGVAGLGFYGADLSMSY